MLMELKLKDDVQKRITFGKLKTTFHSFICFSLILFSYTNRVQTRRVSETSNMESSNLKNTKILCLHGYRQNSKSFRLKTGAFRKLFKKSVEFHFLDAPHQVDSDVSDELTWWYTETTKDNKTYSLIKPTTLCLGFNESIESLKNIILKEGPFDGVMGFSQGAAFLALACASIPEFTKNFKFVVLVSGFKSNFQEHATFYENEINIPSLHIIGKTDNEVTCDRCEALQKCFNNSTSAILYHDGGHYVPAKSHMKNDLFSFLEKYS